MRDTPPALPQAFTPPGPSRPELSTRELRGLAGFHTTLFPLVINMGFPDNVGVQK